MNTIIFASNNANKAREIRTLLPQALQLITLQEAGIFKDIPEPYDTLRENAYEKAKVIYELTGNNCFSEDSGLMVEALNDTPGVKSARYAGEVANDENNIALLLHNLKDTTNRTAKFCTVICLQLQGDYFYFDGECAGRIITEKRGSQGFGYDPVFIPEGADKTFAEMDMAEKSEYSHRKKATLKLIRYLNKKYGES